MTYASFWKRTAAYLIDGFIYQFITFVIAFGIGLIIGLSGAPEILASLAGFLVSIVVWLIYFAVAESSSWQATVGKKMMGLKVTDLNGQQISFWRSVGRNLGMIISTLILCIGYLMCFWTEKKQCLHDYMAGCLVIDNTPNEKQGCAVAVIVAWILSVIFMVGLLTAIALPQYTRAVERSRMAEAYTNLTNANAAQQIYKRAHHAPATRWNQLDVSFNCAAQNDPKICVKGLFTYELAKDTITATRNGTDVQYTLSVDSNGKFDCNGQTEWTRSLCQYFVR